MASFLRPLRTGVIVGAGLLFSMLLWPSAAQAGYWFQTGTASNANVYNSGTGHNESALVNFALNLSGQLVITLTNTQTASYVYQPADVLTAVFFSLGTGNGPTLTPVSAMVAPGSNVYNGAGQLITPTPGGGNVGGEWAYLNTSGTNNSPNNNNQGISSTGVFGFGQPNFNGTNLGGPAALDGAQFGLVGTGYLGNGIVGNSNNSPQVSNSIVFVLSGLPSGFSLDSVSNVTFLYGTSAGEFTTNGVPGPPPGSVVPEPPTVMLAGLGLMGMAWARVRRSIHDFFRQRLG